MINTLVTDTSVVYAALVRSDRNHAACVELLSSSGVVVVPHAVVVETGLLSLSRGQPQAVERLLGSIVDGSIAVLTTDREDYRRVGELMFRYADLPLGIVDATVVATAERLEETTIASLDRRHFSVLKPLHCEAFTLVP